MKENRIKIYGLILGILLFIGLVAGLTYAYYNFKDTAGISGEAGICFNINTTNGGNITDADLLLLDENNIINNGSVTITNGMALTSITAGIDSSCTGINGYLSINIEDITMDDNFISGDSIGALKYIVASYSKEIYPTVGISNLSGQSFTILKTGSITSTNADTLYVDILPNDGTTKDYLIIFYIDGDLAGNGIATYPSNNFTSTIEAVATQSNTATYKVADYITTLYNGYPKTEVINNSITYNYATSGNLMEDTLGNIRYYGKEPHNYVYFNCETYPETNCELWRIIGIVDGKIKLVRDESIGSYSWDTSASDVNEGNGINEWSQADLMKLLNPGYESNTDLNSSGDTITVTNSLYYNSESGTCYNGQSNATTTCDFTSTGIKNDTTKKMIESTVYYLGGGGNARIYSNDTLSMERGNDVIQNPRDGITRNVTWTGKVALMYQSDYGYATDFTKCSQNLYNYGSSCYSNDWLYNGSDQWLLSPISSTDRGAWYISASGRTYSNYIPDSGCTKLREIRPVLYLSPNITIIPRDGISTNPYRISAD
ncbi:MAG: hypothetical protein ACI4VL_00145 [Bacilli bacterium]